MGNSQSLAEDLRGNPTSGADLPPESEEGADEREVRVYCFRNGSWNLEKSRTTYEIFDANEDAGEAKPFRWTLAVEPAEDALIGEHLCAFFDKQKRSDEKLNLKFCYVSAGKTYALRFARKTDYEAFKESFHRAKFANKHNKELNEEAIKETYGNDFKHWAKGEDPSTEMEWENPAEEPARQEQSTPTSVAKNRGKGQHDIYIGALDNTFMLSPGRLDVLRNEEGGLRGDESSHVSLTDAEGSNVTPSKLALADREKSALYVTPESSKKGSIGQLDLERGQTVRSWQASLNETDMPVSEISQAHKSSQLDDESQFYFIHDRRVGMFDKRTPKGDVGDAVSELNANENLTKSYASRNLKFTKIAVTGDGSFAVGDRDGRIRLFSESGKMAKTAFPGLGFEITALDVTFDGSFLVATTENFLLLLATTFRNKKGKLTNGFREKMGPETPAPRMLRLLPTDAAKLGRAPFRNGRFTWVTEAGREERRIVATCGKSIVTFNFRKVKAALAPGKGQTTFREYSLSEQNAEFTDAAMLHESYSHQGNDVAAGATADGSLFINPVKELF